MPKPYLRLEAEAEALIKQHSAMHTGDEEFYFIPAAFKKVKNEEGVYELVKFDELPIEVFKEFITQIVVM